MTELDDIDHALLRLLRQDARRTFSEMAERVGLSVAAVKRRVDRLRELGVITGFTAQIDYAKLGWGIEAFTELRYAGSAPVSEIIRTATVAPEVQAIYTTAGDPDALVSIRARDMRHLQQVIDTLRRAGNVTGTKTLMILDVWTRSDADPTTPPRPTTPTRTSPQPRPAPQRPLP
ncbi:Lrp/AsnC family transcriptional regulator [Actinomadura rupiterrae]|uniref:Lrp/AsnC family transcriptional regulator n=1 Tax=Actinomadura rupiterrae TaxID=559627 RepID=UPI0020A2EFB8|nr:Lrp/AsnC family transcriptional regulator [Actinomadura rupiterrae]MCP2337996.1 DNA-binding Lrp family transcriptional regulator [Actinomadura rupiterrae]